MGGRLITEKGEAMRGFVGTAHCISKMTREQNGQTRVEFAMDQIIQHILELNMRPGDQLPSEYELSKKLGVGRSTLREAIKRLVSRNVLETWQGAGTFVAEKTGVPEDPLGLTFISEGDNIKLALELSDVRMLVEPACAALAADHATSAQVKKMYELCEEIKLAVSTWQDYIKPDTKLHCYIADCCGNSVLRNLVSIMGDAAKVSIEITRDRHRDVAYEEHLRIVHAIAHHDVDGARYAMLSHLFTARNDLMQRLNAAGHQVKN